jgi:hypothetical protein
MPGSFKKAEIGRMFPLYFGFFVVILYYLCALYILLSNAIQLEEEFKWILSGLIVVYASIRLVRLIRKWREDSNDTQEKNEELFL